VPEWVTSTQYIKYYERSGPAEVIKEIVSKLRTDQS